MALGSANPLLLATAASGGDDSTPADPVTRSLRFNDADNSHLYFDPTATHDSSTVYTFSCWAKLGEMDAESYEIFTAGDYTSSTNQDLMYFGHDSNSKLRVWLRSTVDGENTSHRSTAVFRDPSAWYHLLLVRNGASLKAYVNNTEVISETISSTQRYGVGNGHPMHIGSSVKPTSSSVSDYGSFDGLLADIYFTDGYAKAPTDFIEDAGYGAYKPKAYTGSFGTNGFHIDAQPAHDADLLVSSVGRNGGDTTFVDVAAGHTITTNGDTEHSIAVGNPFTSDDRGIYFDASGDYVTVDDSDDLTLSTDDWTIEGWFKWDGATSEQWSLAQKSWAGSSYGTGSDWHIYYYSGYLRFYGSYYAYDGNNRYFSRSFTPTLGKWHHVAVVQNSGSTQLYVDGKELGTAQNTSGWSWNNSTGDLTLNKWQGVSSSSTYSRPDRAVYDFRIVKGTAVYTGEFTPPSGKLTATGGEYPSTTNVNTSITSSHTVLHLQPVKTDSSLHDETSNHTVSKTSGTSYDKASTPYEAAAKSTAIYFDGSGDYLNIGTTSDFRTTTNNFTLDFWYKAIDDWGNVFSNTPDGNVYDGFETRCSTSGVRAGFRNSSSSDDVLSLQWNTSSDTDWHHVEVSRTGSNVYLFIDGTLEDSGTLSFTPTDSGVAARIGRRYGNSYPTSNNYEGYLFDYRWSNSGGHTASFTAPTAPLELNPVYLGGDQSGNKNHFTPSGISITHDLLLDTPTKNYCTLNPLDDRDTPLSEGNLRAGVGSTYSTTAGTFGMESGKWIWSTRINSTGGGTPAPSMVPASKSYSGRNVWAGASGEGWSYALSTYSDLYYNGSVLVSNLFSASDEGEIAWAVDIDAGKAWLGTVSSGSVTWYNSGDPANGTNATFTFTAGTAMKPAISSYGSGSNGSLNFGQDATYAGLESPSTTYADSNGNGSFGFQPPNGFLALCSDNLDDPTVTPSETFNTVLYNGSYDGYNGTGTDAQSITGVGFSPSIVWIKDRDGQSDTHGSGYSGHFWFDSVLGSGNPVNIEAYQGISGTLNSGYNGVSSFDSDGFSVDEADETNYSADTDYDYEPDTPERYVAWCWKLGTTASSWSGSGQDPDSEQYNSDAGVSIINYTDGDYAGTSITLNHSLGAAPEFALALDYDGVHGTNYAWHKDLSSGNYLELSNNGSPTSDSTYFPSGLATNTTFEVGTSLADGLQSHIALFRSVEGYSKFGSYTGNGDANGPFIYTGFRPAFVMIKNIDNSSVHWNIHDSARDPHNLTENRLSPNNSNAEDTGWDEFDFLSNGFKAKAADTGNNGNGDTIIYAAFAESPLKYSNAK